MTIITTNARLIKNVITITPNMENLTLEYTLTDESGSEEWDYITVSSVAAIIP